MRSTLEVQKGFGSISFVFLFLFLSVLNGIYSFSRGYFFAMSLKLSLVYFFGMGNWISETCWLLDLVTDLHNKCYLFLFFGILF